LVSFNFRHFTYVQITAQGVIFFVAGFETTANTLSTISYHLAKNPDIQVRFIFRYLKK
jgi:cytochrome P450